jgi:endonuclease III
MKAIRIVTAAGGRFSQELGIDLDAGRSGDVFRWFLASVLFGARISETIVKHTVQAFEQAGVTTPEAIERTGWDGLVAILDRGGYVRYDFKTATKLLDLCRTLRERYQSDLDRLHAEASDSRDLEERLTALAKGIGSVTVNIFLREMRGIWRKAQPLPSDLVMLAAGNIGIFPGWTVEPEQALALLQEQWKESKGRAKDFPDLESALLRIGKNYCRKKACDACPVRPTCSSASGARRRHGTDHYPAARRDRARRARCDRVGPA